MPATTKAGMQLFDWPAETDLAAFFVMVFDLDGAQIWLGKKSVPKLFDQLPWSMIDSLRQDWVADGFRSFPALILRVKKHGNDTDFPIMGTRGSGFGALSASNIRVLLSRLEDLKSEAKGRDGLTYSQS